MPSSGKASYKGLQTVSVHPVNYLSTHKIRHRCTSVTLILWIYTDFNIYITLHIGTPFKSV